MVRWYRYSACFGSRLKVKTIPHISRNILKYRNVRLYAVIPVIKFRFTVHFHILFYTVLVGKKEGNNTHSTHFISSYNIIFLFVSVVLICYVLYLKKIICILYCLVLLNRICF